MADLNASQLQSLQREVRENQRLVVKLRCDSCQEAVPEKLRFACKWYTWVSVLAVIALYGLWGVLVVLAGFPFVCVHVHRCARCDKEILRGNYVEMVVKRRKLDTLGLMYPFYAGSFLLAIAIVWNDMGQNRSWEQYKALCGPALNSSLSDIEYKEHFHSQEIFWTGDCYLGWYLGVLEEAKDGNVTCAGVMMDYRIPGERDVVLCGEGMEDWGRGVLVEYIGVMESREGPRVRMYRGEVLSSYPFLPPTPGFLSPNTSLSF